MPPSETNQNQKCRARIAPEIRHACRRRGRSLYFLHPGMLRARFRRFIRPYGVRTGRRRKKNIFLVAKFGALAACAVDSHCKTAMPLYYYYFGINSALLFRTERWPSSASPSLSRHSARYRWRSIAAPVTSYSKMAARTLVQYVVLRGDLRREPLSWPLGALVAQACHAALAVTHAHCQHPDTAVYLEQGGSMRTVVLEVSAVGVACCVGGRGRQAGLPCGAAAAKAASPAGGPGWGVGQVAGRTESCRALLVRRTSGCERAGSSSSIRTPPSPAGSA